MIQSVLSLIVQQGFILQKKGNIYDSDYYSIRRNRSIDREKKLRRSLKRVGTDDNLVNPIIDEVTNKLSPGMSTHAIYQIALRLLRSKSRTLVDKE